jgi:hypothetical protein
MSDHRPDEHDDPLLRKLRELAREVDPVPDDVSSYAKAALGWRRIDAELAELLSDSATETEAAALTRAGRSEARFLRFAAGEISIAVEIRERDGGLTILGQLAPPLSASIEIQRDDATVAATAETDELGRFRIELPEGGRIRLRVASSDPAHMLETSWIDF